MLTVTQKQVLKVLVENKDKYLSTEDIWKLCRVNRNHIISAIKFFMNHDYVYPPNIEDKVMVSLDGIELYYNS